MAHRSTKVTNIAASVLDRLKNLADQSGQRFAELLLLYALEGFLRRLTHSSYREHLVLKGGLLLFGMRANVSRPTRDLDLMGLHLPIDLESVAAMARELCTQTLPEDDGLHFDPQSVETEIIIEEGHYQGVRAKLYAYLNRTRSRVVIDIAAGDPIIPGPRAFSYITLLGQPLLQLQSYSLESVISEKFHAFVDRGLRTSRLKDCYDLWLLSSEHSFDGKVLQQAIQATFAARGLAFTAELPIILTPAFAEDVQKQQQWATFRAAKSGPDAPAALAEALAPVIALLKPLWEASGAGQVFSGSWNHAAGVWQAAQEDQPDRAEPSIPAEQAPGSDNSDNSDTPRQTLS